MVKTKKHVTKKREITKRVIRDCSICGKTIKVIVYVDNSYRGGHRFGGAHPKKGIKYEYWECPTCYWRGK